MNILAIWAELPFEDMIPYIKEEYDQMKTKYDAFTQEEEEKDDTVPNTEE
jgi:hypothetical protein